MRLPHPLINDPEVQANFEALEEDTNWIEPPLLNAWTEYGSGSTIVAYRRVLDRVYLKGTVKNKESGKDLFILPKIFCPSEQYNFIGIGETEGTGVLIPVYVRILPMGNVALFYNTTAAFLSIDGCSFSVD